VSPLDVAAYGLLAIGVTVAMIAVDYAHARYALAMAQVRHLREAGQPWRDELERAARWSVLQWGAAGVAFVVNVKVSIWFLPFEALGLYWGTKIGGSRRLGSDVGQS
jgi:hypothetical protein